MLGNPCSFCILLPCLSIEVDHPAPNLMVSQHYEPNTVTLNDTTIGDLRHHMLSNATLPCGDVDDEGEEEDPDVSSMSTTAPSVSVSFAMNKTFPAPNHPAPRRPRSQKPSDMSAMDRLVTEDGDSMRVSHQTSMMRMAGCGNITVMETRNRNVFDRVSKAVSLIPFI